MQLCLRNSEHTGHTLCLLQGRSHLLPQADNFPLKGSRVEVCVALSTPQIAGSEGRTGSLPDSSHVVHTPMLRTDGQARAQHCGGGGKEDSVGTQ